MLEDRLNHLEKTDRYTVQKDIQMFDGRNVQLATGTGTKIATATSQKLAFYGITPVIQQTIDATNITDLTTCAQVTTDIRAKLRLTGLAA